MTNKDLAATNFLSFSQQLINIHGRTFRRRGNDAQSVHISHFAIKKKTYIWGKGPLLVAKEDDSGDRKMVTDDGCNNSARAEKSTHVHPIPLPSRGI